MYKIFYKSLSAFAVLFFLIGISFRTVAQSTDCSGAIQICNNQLNASLDDGFGTQQCPSGGCGCLSAGEKNSRWYKMVISTSGILRFKIQPYGTGTADYDWALFAAAAGGGCPASFGTPTRCNFDPGSQPTGMSNNGNDPTGSSADADFETELAVTAGQTYYLLVDNYTGNTVGFTLDLFSVTNTTTLNSTAGFSCTGVNTCNSCGDPDCGTYTFPIGTPYGFDATAAQGACHADFANHAVGSAGSAGASTTADVVCGVFTPNATAVQLTNRGYEIEATGAASSSACINAVSVAYQVWDNNAANCPAGGIWPVAPDATGLVTGLTIGVTYKVCKTTTITYATPGCYLVRNCLPLTEVVENDVVCTAKALTVDAPAITGSNNGANATFNAGCTAAHDVFYKFVAPASGRIQVTVSGGTLDAEVSLLGADIPAECGLACTAITDAYRLAGCYDNAIAGGSESFWTFVIPGQTYYVWVDGVGTSQGTFNVAVSSIVNNPVVPTASADIRGVHAIPVQDDCNTAVLITKSCVVTAGSNKYCTPKCTDPAPATMGASTLENTAWYKWVADGAGEVRIDMTSVNCTPGVGTATTAQLGIYEGTCAALVPKASGLTSVTFTAVAGVTYYIVIDGNAGAQCDFNLEIKRPKLLTQSCGAATVACAGTPLGATMTYSYLVNDPGMRWAYCEGAACTINLDDPSTYKIYDPAVGLPAPTACAPTAFKFVGYILLDNGTTKFGAPYAAYPKPQATNSTTILTAGNGGSATGTNDCLRQTNPCTLTIYPKTSSLVTTVYDGCNQNVSLTGSCAANYELVVAGAIVASPYNQNVAAGTVTGTFTAVTVRPKLATYPSAPACASLTIANPRNCPSPISDNICTATSLTLGAAPYATSNASAVYNSVENNTSSAGAGYAIWFQFVAPTSGRVNIALTSVGTTNGIDPVIELYDAIVYTTGLNPDLCESCTNMQARANWANYRIGARDNAGANANETMAPANYSDALGGTGQLQPGQTYYFTVDGSSSFFTSTANQQGNFSVQVTDAGGGPARPVNDEIAGAIDISSGVCCGFAGTNIGGTSPCTEPLLISGSSETSVWYKFTPSATAQYSFGYENAQNNTGACGDGAMQFSVFLQNATTGALSAAPATAPESNFFSTGAAGTTSGFVNITLTAGTTYFVMMDGFSGNYCNFDFVIKNQSICCGAKLGVVEGGNKTLCSGESATWGVSDFDGGSGSRTNPVVGWAYHLVPLINPDPLNAANNAIINGYYTGVVSKTATAITTHGTSSKSTSNAPPGFSSGTTYESAVKVCNGAPGRPFISAASDVKVCINFTCDDVDNLRCSLLAPDGVTSIPLINADVWPTSLLAKNPGTFNMCFVTGASALSTINSAAGLAVNHAPNGSFATLVGQPVNGTWKLQFSDNYTDGSGVNFNSWRIDLNGQYNTFGPTHGDITQTNKNPYLPAQEYYMTPVTFIDGLIFDANCHAFGPSVKVQNLEQVSAPTYTATCGTGGTCTAGADNANITVTAPTGGMPGMPSTFNSSPTSLALTDGAATGTFQSNAITIPAGAFDAGATLTSENNIRVCLVLNHPNAADIDAYLVSPSGGLYNGANSWELTTDNGGTNDFYGTYCFYLPLTQGNITAVTSLAGVVNADNWTAEAGYANINGDPIAGAWTLYIHDDATGSTGSLDSWSISIEGPNTNKFGIAGTGGAAALTGNYNPSAVLAPFTSNSNAVWETTFTDGNSCATKVGGKYKKALLTDLDLLTPLCKTDAVKTFTIAPEPPKYTTYRVTIDTDTYPEEIYWSIRNGAGYAVISGGPYQHNQTAAITTTSVNLPAADGPYTYYINDIYGDGMIYGGGSFLVEELRNGVYATAASHVYPNLTGTFTAEVYPLADPVGNLTGTIGTSCSALCAPTGAAPATVTYTTGSTTGTFTPASATTGNNTFAFGFTDIYGCQLCKQKTVEVFPGLTALTITPDCAATPKTVSAVATTSGTLAGYALEYSYDGGATWTTSASGTFSNVYVYARVKNTTSSVTNCEFQSAKITTCAPTPLPIQLTTFNGKVNNTTNELYWQTATEQNSAWHVVERSIDGINGWTEVGRRKAVGNSTTLQNYTLTDEKPLIRGYYRLRNIDFDGKVQLSNVIVLERKRGGFGFAAVYPIPTNEGITVDYETETAEEVTFRVIDVLGQVLSTQVQAATKGINTVLIDLSNYPNGNYVLLMDNGTHRNVTKIVKAR